MTKPTKWCVRLVKTQISLGIHQIWSESSLYIFWVAKDPMLFYADIEDSNQTWWVPRLIWVFAGRTGQFCCFCHAAAQFIVFIHCFCLQGCSVVSRHVIGSQLSQRSPLSVGPSRKRWTGTWLLWQGKGNVLLSSKHSPPPPPPHNSPSSFNWHLVATHALTIQ